MRTAPSPYYGLLGLAFAKDPMVSWLFEDPRRPYIVHDVFDFMFRLGAGIGRVEDIRDARGRPQALLLTTTEYSRLDSLGNILRAGVLHLLGRIGPRNFAAMLSYNAKAGAMHRKYGRPDDHYVFILGVDPEDQGQGLGSRLLQDLAGRLPPGSRVYLETSNPANIPFYLRNGFIQLDDYRVPGTTVHIWPMLLSREPLPS